MNLSKFKAKKESVPMVIRHPETGEELTNDKGKKCLCYIHGNASSKFQDFLVEEVNAQLKKTIGKNEPPSAVKDYKEMMEDETKELQARVDKFENVEFEEYDVSTPEGIAGVMADPSYEWLHNQVKVFAAKKSNFF